MTDIAPLAASARAPFGDPAVHAVVRSAAPARHLAAAAAVRPIRSSGAPGRITLRVVLRPHREGQGSFAPVLRLSRIRISLHTTTSRVIAAVLAIVLIVAMSWATTPV
ncbi:hypothetical protein ACFYV7_30515 [Nocardia suismassiliense]|uniref:Uncharacterized protein n=1 Tax=Nocardia suismassiliense TaxID=2077092 RepID=A0ABW6R0Z0_9NOCA